MIEQLNIETKSCTLLPSLIFPKLIVSPIQYSYEASNVDHVQVQRIIAAALFFFPFLFFSSPHPSYYLIAIYMLGVKFMIVMMEYYIISQLV